MAIITRLCYTYFPAFTLPSSTYSVSQLVQIHEIAPVLTSKRGDFGSQPAVVTRYKIEVAKLDMGKALCKQSPPGKTQAHVIPSLARASLRRRRIKRKRPCLVFGAKKEAGERGEEVSFLCQLISSGGLALALLELIMFLAFFLPPVTSLPIGSSCALAFEDPRRKSSSALHHKG